MTRIIGHLCVKNEADRYLSDVLDWHHRFLDDLYVYDDVSTDETATVAAKHATVRTRFLGISFEQDESCFRGLAWESMAHDLRPEAGDWILCLDADEFFVSSWVQPRQALEDLIGRVSEHCTGIDLRIHEIFDIRNGVPMRRVDGFWGAITGTRLVPYLDEDQFTSKAMGGGSVPASALRCRYDAQHLDGSILHYGYARPADRATKHQRYTNHQSSGHNPRHIESILTRPHLEPIYIEGGLP